MKPVLAVNFFRTNAGMEPVRIWLKNLVPADRKTIGEDIKTVQFGWPLGMPLVKHVDEDIWEVRVKLDNRLARIFSPWKGLRWFYCMASLRSNKPRPRPNLIWRKIGLND